MAVKAATLMTGAAPISDDEAYTDLLIAIQTGNRNAFEKICNDKSITDDEVILELWAAAVGSQSTEAQAAYPGSAGW